MLMEYAGAVIWPNHDRSRKKIAKKTGEKNKQKKSKEWMMVQSVSGRQEVHSRSGHGGHLCGLIAGAEQKASPGGVLFRAVHLRGLRIIPGKGTVMCVVCNGLHLELMFQNVVEILHFL